MVTGLRTVGQGEKKNAYLSPLQVKIDRSINRSVDQPKDRRTKSLIELCVRKVKSEKKKNQW